MAYFFVEVRQSSHAGIIETKTGQIFPAHYYMTWRSWYVLKNMQSYKPVLVESICQGSSSWPISSSCSFVVFTSYMSWCRSEWHSRIVCMLIVTRPKIIWLPAQRYVQNLIYWKITIVEIIYWNIARF